MNKLLLLCSLACCSFNLQAGSWFKSDIIKNDETVIFFPSEASLSEDETHWTVHYHGWIYEAETLGEINTALRTAMGLTAKADDDSLLKKRLQWFAVDNERGKRITIQLAGRQYELNRSNENGHFSGQFNISSKQIDWSQSASTHPVIHFETSNNENKQRAYGGQLLLIPATGLSVISDIDDTIKVSNVSNKKELLKNTFMRPFQAAPGMSDLYQQWATQDSAIFHYVSASPWQLYPDLSAFMLSHQFPTGLFHLKSFRWKDRSFLNLFADPIQYKVDIIEQLLKRYPQRRFILVGDSGEKDPEVYGNIARLYPKQIERILIRKVGNNNSKTRFKTAFAELNPKLWKAFTQINEVEKRK